jgi:translocation and assembly module TamB
VGELREVTRLGRVAEGKVAATVTARLDPSGELDATVRGAYQNLHQGLLRSAAGSLQARVSGPLDRLTTESSLISEGLDLGGFRVRRAMAGAAGPLLSPSVRVVLLDERWKSLSLAADLRLQPAPRVEDLRLRFQGDERVQVDARVKQISASAAGIELRGIEVQGPSAQAQGAVLLREDGFKLDLAEGQVDLAGFARYLAPGVGAPALGRLTSGTLTFGGKLDAKGAQRSGTFSARVRDLCSREHPVVLHGEAHLGLWDQQVSSTFRTEALQGECGAAIPQGPSPASPLLASARGQAVGTIQGSLLSPGNWERASGSVELFDLKVDLDQLSRHPLVEELRARRSKGPAPQRIPRIQGTLAATTRITRTSPERFPEIQATFVSEQLAVELPPQGDAPRRLEGLNVSGLLALAPSASAPRELRAALRLAAHAGPNQAQITAATSFEPDALRRALAGLSGPDPLAGLRSLPVESDFLLPQQPIETLPPALRPLPLAGLASARGRLQGSLDRPELSAEVDIRNLHTSIELLNRWSLDVSLAGTMGEGGVVVSGGAQHRSVGGARQDGKASFWVMSTRRPGDLLWGRGTRWQADAELSLDRWHLETIPMLAERGVQGQVSGTLQALRMHVQPHLRAQLALENMKIADTEVAPTRVRASIQESESEVVVSSQQPPSGGEAGGELELAALPQVRFEDQLVPSLDASKAHRLDLRLRNFDIEPFSPLVAPLLADLRGRLDGSFSLSFGAKEEQNRISGGLRWSRGVLLIPQLGQTFTEGHFNLSTTEDRGARETRIDLRDLRLSASTGGIEGEASFHVPNDALARYLLPAEGGATPPTIRGEFSAVIPPSEKIPVTFEGLALGDAHGKTSGVIQFRPGELRVDVAIPELTFDLPETTSQQNLQSLGENPLIGVIEASRQARKREEAPTTPMTVLLNVGLGATLDDLQQDREPSGSILVRRASVDVKLAGITRSTLVGELAMFGTVETFSGRIVVLGKPFDVRRGFVRFEGQPTNPYLNVGATWDAPDGTRVFADLLGYLKDAKLRLRSEPARPESDVLSLVLFGRDPSASTTTPGGPSSTSGSLAVGSGVASTLLNSFIDPVQVFGRRIETRVESTSHRGTSIGVAAELRPRLWAQVDVSTASQRERQNTDLSAVTLDWRFRPAWSLRSTVGDRGSSLLELLWQFKY